jgi:hypothetical protein
MLTSVRNHLMTTAMAMTPFLLSACGDEGNDPSGPNFEIVAIPVLLYTALLAHDWLRRRSGLLSTLPA